MNSPVIYQGIVVDHPAAKTKRERAIELGKRPYGATFPAIFLCGQCRAAQVKAEQGICYTCEKIFINRGER